MRRAAGCLTAVLLAAIPARAFQPEIMDSVVAVVPHWPGFPPAGSGREAPEGTAVAVLPGGYLATNAHVLGKAERVDIRLADGRLVAAEIVGRDAPTDLALLKAPGRFPVPEMAPAPALGAKVCAVGNQFGLGLSVTCGVVSASRRSNAGFNPIEDFIQTDASVNPGGSGGALVDAEGRLVGLVSVIFTKKGDANIGVNFAASAALVGRVAADLRDHGRVLAADAGFRVARLGAEARRRHSGARVVKVRRGGPALAAGLQAGDIVTRVAGRAVIHPGDVAATLYLKRPGDTVEIAYLRDGAAATLELRLGP